METRSDARHSHQATDHPRRAVKESGRRAAREPGKRAAKEPGIWRGVLSGMFSVALVGLLLVLGAVVVVPKVLGGAGLTVLSSSMEPTYSPGDMVVSVPQDDYAIGDVVTFQPVSGDPTRVTHRIVAHQTGDTAVQYVTRGDANGNDDEPIVGGQIMGKVIYHVPYVGHLSLAVGEHRNLLIGAAATGLLGYAVYAITAGVLQGRRNKAERS